MRCRALATRLTAMGHECRFVSRDLPGNLNNLIAQDFPLTNLPEPTAGFVPRDTDPVHAKWAAIDWHTDTVQTRKAFGFTDWLVVDHYAFDFRWEQAARPYANAILVLDDLADRQHDCEILLDHSLGRRAKDYDGLMLRETRLLLGVKHALLRPEFAAMRAASLARRKDGHLRHVLVAMGGIDTNDAVKHILRAIADLPQAAELSVTVLTSKRSPNVDALVYSVEEMPYACHIHFDAQSVAELMAEADIAISASGMMAYELACMGLPMLLLPASPIQTAVASELVQIAEARVVKQWMGNPKEQIYIALKDFLRYLADLPPRCRRIAQSFDGYGAERVAQVMSLSLDTQPT